MASTLRKDVKNKILQQMSIIRTKTIDHKQLHEDDSDSLEDDEEELEDEDGKVQVSRMSDSSNESNE